MIKNINKIQTPEERVESGRALGLSGIGNQVRWGNTV
jgi:hypothetical protein